MPRGQNINKAFSVHQEKDETPTDWLERLRKGLQMYSRVDPDSPAGAALLATQFVAKLWGDIKKKKAREMRGLAGLWSPRATVESPKGVHEER